MKTQARVVVIGGGMMGVGLLYHLVKEGWSDVVLIEKGELTSGSTWHAAGLVPHFVGSLAMAQVHAYGIELYRRLEAETGQATGWHECGALRLAVTPEQADWYRQVKGILDYVGAESHLVGREEIRAIHPLLDPHGVVLAVHTPGDGHTDPSGTTQALAIGARSGGAEIYRHNRVLEIRPGRGGEWQVITEAGTIVCEHVVNAAGSFADRVAAMVGLKAPFVNMVHQYLVTESIPEVEGLEREPPVTRDPYASCYYRREGGGLIVGPYEMRGAEAWALEGVDWGFDMELLEPRMERLEPWLERAMERIPAFAEAGIKRVVCGPITHTPDSNFLLGPAPGRRNFWMCCGASIGITQGAGAGKYLAQWMVHGQAEINMSGFDPRRFGDWAVGEYTLAKAVEDYQHMYQVLLPGEEREAGRGMRTPPIHARLRERGARFIEVGGWERPKWFDRTGEGERYSFRRSNVFAAVAEECRAVRERVGVLDLSSFAKLEVSGPAAHAFLDRVCANRLPRGEGGIVLTQMLGERGTVECEATVTRLAADRFYLLSAALAQVHDRDWLERQRRDGEAVAIEDVTDRYATLVLAGPRAREVLARLTAAPLDSGAFPWLRAREIEVAGVAVRALRISYVGELGWELHHPIEHQPALYEALLEAGAEHGIADFGTYAVNSLRMEKAYRAWGAELTNEVTPLEAGMGRFVDLGKPFVGREALIEQRRRGLRQVLAYLEVEAGDADPAGSEPLWAEGRIVGITTSGGYGHAVGKSLAFAYLEPSRAAIGTELEVALLDERRPARVIAEPAYDPDNARLRA